MNSGETHCKPMAHCRWFSDNRRGVQMRISELFVTKKNLWCFCMEKRAEAVWTRVEEVNFMQTYFIDGP